MIPPWLGPDPPDDGSIVPFRIDVPDAVLDDLRRRVARTRWPRHPEGTSWERGTDQAWLRDLCDHWVSGYDWRTVEAAVNRHPQVLTRVDGQRLHALHRPSPHPDAFPVVLLHGWPGAFLEFLDVVDVLADPVATGGPAGAALHVVCPSLPGYGFSGPTTAPGWTVARMADAVDELMRRLGYDRYGAQGGDWGAMVATQLAVRHPDRVAGIHLNMVIAPRPVDEDDPYAGLSEREHADLRAMSAARGGEQGYRDIQSTAPQTLGVGLHDSPAGLCAWIVEKFRAWSDRFEAGPDGPGGFTPDQLLDIVTLYWVTGTINSANRLYRETRVHGGSMPEARVEVSTGHARFPAEGFRPPRRWVERRYRITHWTDMPRGGHFAALEAPDLFAPDVSAFFATVR